MRSNARAAAHSLGLLLVIATSASAQIRIVTYNTLDNPTTALDRSQVNTIFDAIATTSRNGIAKRPDIVSLQEQTTLSATTSTASQIADELNALYGVTSYVADLNGGGVDRIGVVYDSSTVELLSEFSVGTPGPRPTQRTLFRPVGYGSADAEFYLYSSHLSASSASTRAAEATSIRNNANALGSDANVIYLGDLNIGSSNETTYANYRAAGAAQAFDPLGLAFWPSILGPEHLTQSTRTSALADGGAGGGLDDRFDFQLVTDDLLDGEGVSYLGPSSTGLGSLEHSYQAFGNDGVSYNTNINNTFTGRSQSAAVLNALFSFSDHLPVVADYQLPAILEVLTDAVPSTLELGEPFDLEVTVSNAADVVAAAGADELDYVLSVTGDLSGAASGSELALSGGATHFVGFDTSTAGLKSGVLTVSTSSQAVSNSLVEIPISFEVLEPLTLAGDFDDDGQVTAQDYAIYRAGASPNGLGTSADYDDWAANFGAGVGSAVGNAAVPEPAAAALLLLTIGGILVRRR